jgi:hypothetical protein
MWQNVKLGPLLYILNDVMRTSEKSPESLVSQGPTPRTDFPFIDGPRP